MCWSVCSSISIARRRFGAPSFCSTEATWRRTVTCEIPRRDAIWAVPSWWRRRWKTSNSRACQLDLRLVGMDQDATPHPALAKLQDQACGHSPREGGLTLGDAADRMRETARGSAHQQIPVGAGAQRLEQVLIRSGPRHHHDLRVGDRLLDQPRGLDPAPREVHRDDADIRLVRHREAHGIVGMGRLGDNLQAVRLDGPLDPLANSDLVVGHQHPQSVGRGHDGTDPLRLDLRLRPMFRCVHLTAPLVQVRTTYHG